MKNVALTVLLLIGLLSARAQVVTSSPVVPVHSKPATITFDAAQGTAGLKDYEGTVYAHTGVITSKSTGASDWKYVNNTWGENLPKYKLTAKGNNRWELSISPSIREWYGVPEDEVILKMAFVFRSGEPKTTGKTDFLEGKDDGGKDIFIDVSEDDFNLAITAPRNNSLFKEGDSIALWAASSVAARLALYGNGVELKQAPADTLIGYTITNAAKGNYTLVATAVKGAQAKSDTVRFVVRGESEEAAKPAGMSDGVNYNATDKTKVTLVLCAPQKSFVYVVGDFNGWMLSNDYMMKKDGDRFWITLSNLAPGKEYRFQYAVDGSIFVGDPYSEKVLDEWNDKYITDTTYANLLPYPEGKANGYVSVLQTGQAPYPWLVQDFKAPNKSDLVIYELLLRDFVKQHSYASLIDTLPYLQRLGINAIELLPFNEFDGNESWGYNPAYYCSPDKAYGSAKMLKRFIDECHRRGIAVIMDIALNHAFGNSPTVKMYWDAANKRPADDSPYHNAVAKHPYNVGEDFNHSSPYTQELVRRVVEYWLREYKIDGYRFDLSKGFTQNYSTDLSAWSAYDQSRIDNWKRISGQVWAVKSDAYVILEHLGEYWEELELSNNGMMLWSNQQPSYAEVAMGYSNNKSNLQGVQYSAHGFTQPNLVPYMESHDEERIMYDLLQYGNGHNGYSTKNPATALERVAMAAVLFYTVPGPKMLWQFGELGYDYSIGQCEVDTLIHREDCRTAKKPIRWDYAADAGRAKLFDVFSKLIQLKKTYPAIRYPNNFYIGVPGGNNNDLRKWIHAERGDSSLLAVVNADVAQQSFDVYFPNTGKYYELFTGDSVNITGTQWQLTLRPGEYRVYTRTRIGAAPAVVVPPSPYPKVQILSPAANKTYAVGQAATITAVADNADSLLLHLNGACLHRVAGSGLSYTLSSIVAAGTYTLSVTAKNAYDAESASLKIAYTQPSISLSITPNVSSVEVGSSISVSANAPLADSVYLMHNGATVVRKAGSLAGYTITGIADTGTHSFTARAKFGSNVLTTTKQIRATDDKQVTGVAAAQDAEVQLYPNPFGSELSIQSSDIISRVEIYSPSGALVMQHNLPLMRGVIGINTGKLRPGIYMLRLTTDRGVCITKKTVKKNQ